MLAKDPGKRPPQMLALRELLSTIHQKNQSSPDVPRAGASAGRAKPRRAEQSGGLVVLAGQTHPGGGDLRRGLRLDPGHPECLYNLVQLEKRQGRIGHLEALRRLRQARA
jgi:hypothetical protein